MDVVSAHHDFLQRKKNFVFDAHGVHGQTNAMKVGCASRIIATALPDVPRIEPGNGLAEIIAASLESADVHLRDNDVIAIASKLVSRAENRFVDLSTVTASPRARRLAERVRGDPRLVELVLRESVAISRAAPGVLVVRHRLGFVAANACIDSSNARPPEVGDETGPWVLLLPWAPDASARRIRRELQRRCGMHIGVIITDSVGRPFRLGTAAIAVGVSGVPARVDCRGATDLDGRILQHTEVALADSLAVTADLLAGQGAEGRGVVHLRGLAFVDGDYKASDVVRPIDEDLYA